VPGSARARRLMLATEYWQEFVYAPPALEPPDENEKE